MGAFVVIGMVLGCEILVVWNRTARTGAVARVGTGWCKGTAKEGMVVMVLLVVVGFIFLDSIGVPMVVGVAVDVFVAG